MRITSIVAGSLALLASSLPAYAEEPGAAVEATASLSVAPAALEPDQYFKGQTGGTFGKSVTQVILPKSKRVIVAGFRVVFLQANAVTAKVRASYLPGRDSSGASAKLSVALEGVDDATLQAITDKAYADFLAQLAASGREVVPASELAEFNAQMEVAATPYRKESGPASAVAFAPTGMPLWWTQWDAPWTDKGAFSQHNYRSLAPLSVKTNAIVVAPMIVVDFAKLSSSGNRSGLMARSAEVGAELGMSVSQFATPMIFALEARSGLTSKGEEAAVMLQQHFVVERTFGTMEKLAEEDNKGIKGIFDTLGKGMGLANAGGAARSKSANIAKTDNAAYAAAAGEALALSTGTFAGWFQKYPAP